MITAWLLACGAPGLPRVPEGPTLDDGVVRLEVADDADDGHASSRGWSADGEEGTLLVGANRLAAFRFHLPSPLVAAPVYARLVLPIAPGKTGMHLRIRAVMDDDGASLSRRLPPKRAMTTAVVDWEMEPWADPWMRRARAQQEADRPCAPFERTTPDLTPLLAELAPAHPERVTFVLEGVDGGGLFHLLDRAEVTDERCPGVLAARLEVFPDTRSTLVGRELLARPSDDGALLVLDALVDLEVQVELAPDGGPPRVTPAALFPAGAPIHLPLDGFGPDREVGYRVRYRRPGEAEFVAGAEHTFHTARPRGESFTFTLTSDGHLVNAQNRRAWSDLDLLGATMSAAASEDPDFHLDLGDTFNGESYRSFDALDDQEMERRHLDVRPWFERVGADAPLLLALGNHEGEQGWRVAADDPVPALSARWRRRLYPNPTPGGFATGNVEADGQGPLEDYYAFEWGDALIVVLDPYRYTMRKPHDIDGTPGSGDSWDWTLGPAQTEWLRRTLTGSDAAFKLVFSHQVVGGNNTYGRGGRPWPGQGSFEWGGANEDGSPGFAERRPGWEGPVHDLLRDAGVTAFVHGHDHVFVWEPPLDGVAYVGAPQPSDGSYGLGHTQHAAYPEPATLLPNAGYLVFRVSPEALELSYVRVPGDGLPREIAFTHTFPRQRP